MQIQPIATLFDEFVGTTLNTTKWYLFADENTGTPGGNTSSVSGGAITLGQVGSAEWQLISKDNFTWDDSEITWGPISGQWYLATAWSCARAGNYALHGRSVPWLWNKHSLQLDHNEVL